ncbi:MAG: UDP-N-acetylmuramate--L-alanine ligase [Acidimicrobiia bacterium]|nr:UDP-N-acetylmuramate--L-alanine ligase [Acidimicrobiia bacterium]
MAELLTDYPRIHVVGIGGAGMSGLARILSGHGHRVSGSDARPSEVLDSLATEGMDAWSGHRPEAIMGVDLVVASSAVPATDPEVQAATDRGIPVWDRPRLLSEITAKVPTIGPTGTHGKTSTTAMLVAGARAAGRDPSFVVGGELLDLGTNAATGTDELLILEVDEAFGTFEHVHLQGLIVTSIEEDHLDHFENREGVEAAFRRVAAAVDGPVIACLDDPGAAELAAEIGAIGYGFADSATWRIDAFSEHPGESSFLLRAPGGTWPVKIPRPGAHMARNATGALALLAAMGIEVELAIDGLAGFGGVGRRWQVRGTVGAITVVDDYAHHPTEVAATLQAARRFGRRLVAVFQPHLFSRTAAHADAFGHALALADVVVVLDVYGAREEPVPGVDGSLVSDAARRAGAAVVADAPVRQEAAAVVADIVEDGDLVVCMGAGDITELPDELLGRLG